MKAIKNKKRFDPRRFLSERKEETKENVGKTNENFNDFSFDTWLEDKDKKRKEYGETKPKRSSEEEAQLDKEMSKLKPGEEIRRGEHPLVEDPDEGCGDPEMGPEEPQAVPADLSPDEAFGAGYTAAVEEIMASIQGLLEDPMDMGPAGEEEESALVVTQLQEGEVKRYGPDDPTYLITIDPDVDRVERAEKRKAQKKKYEMDAKKEKDPREKTRLLRLARDIEYDTVFWSNITSKNVNTIADWYNKFSDLGYTDIPPNSEIIVKKEVDGEWVDVNDIFDEPGYVEDGEGGLTQAGAEEKYRNQGLEES